MQAFAQTTIQSEAQLSSRHFIFESPWILLKNTHQRVNYEFTTMGSTLEQQDRDCIALSFHSDHSIEPGTLFDIGVPLPDSMRDYQAEVIACMNTPRGFEISLLIKIESDMDLITLMRSNAYMSSQYVA